MAHYIADLIKRVETAAGPDRDTLQRECAAEILRLWSHRHSFQDRQHPMASYESIYRALARLDPENPPWSFLCSFGSDTAPTADQLEINALLKAALAIEDAARDAVRELIVSAAEVASQKEAKWLDLARQIQDEESGLFKVFRRLSYACTDGGSNESEEEGADSEAIQALERLSTACRTARESVELSLTGGEVSG